MAAKQLVFSEDARRRLQRGMDVLATAVVTTLGPKGRNVALDRKFGSPTITHDGVKIRRMRLQGLSVNRQGPSRSVSREETTFMAGGFAGADGGLTGLCGW